MLQKIFADLSDVFQNGEVGELEIEWDRHGVTVLFTGKNEFADYYTFLNGEWTCDSDDQSVGSDFWANEVGL